MLKAGKKPGVGILISSLLLTSWTVYGQSGDANGLSAMGGQASGSTEFENFNEVRLLNDDLRPVNKVFYGVTKPLYDYVAIPLAKGWRWLAPQPVRKSLTHFGYNWSYPVRLVSLALQGEGAKSWQETKHFAVNTTVGVLGFSDAAAKKEMKTYDEDTGQAFGAWGVGHGEYVFIPVLGPSSLRDGTGRIGDYFLNPANYVPGLGSFLSFNALTFKIDGYESLNEGGASLYEPFRGLWAIQREVLVENYTIPEEAYRTGDADLSMGSVWLSKPDRTFIHSGDEEKVRSPATGRKVPFTAWIQSRPAPLVYLIPGIGAHRHSPMAVYLAELLYNQGCSVVTISSPFHPEFIKSGLTALFPGYTPSDSADIRVVLGAIDKKLEGRYPGRFTDRRLTGYSLGALATGVIADQIAAEENPEIQFSRYVLLNPPVDLRYSAKNFDAYYHAFQQWPVYERAERVQEIAKKSFVFIQDPGVSGSPIPFSRSESEFAIGLSVRITLLRAINASKEREEYKGNRQPLRFDDLNAVSSYFYTTEFAGPYYNRAAGLTLETLQQNLGLMSAEKTIAKNKNLKIITNKDDFIINEEGLDWLRAQAGDRLTVFPKGGHLGNLWDEQVQAQILKDLVF